MAPTPIDEVLDKLDAIIEESFNAPSRAGYFAALYRRVTAAIKDKIGAGYFDDDARMEQFDFVFASRYVDAYRQWKAGDPALTSSWTVAFDATAKPYLLILHHLVLGINAHINLDLGIAAAAVAPSPAALDALQDDFDRVNALLAGVVPSLLGELEVISPWIRVLEKFGKPAEIQLAGFAVNIARDFAWMLAKERAALEGQAIMRKTLLDAKDHEVAWVGRQTANPGLLVGMLQKLIWLRESHDVKKNIAVLGAGQPFTMA